MGLTLNKRMIRHCFAFLILTTYKTAFAASQSQSIQITLNWEGRALQDPNLDALEKFRLSYPEVPMLHLLNPSYFLEADTAAENMQNILRIFKEEDEVGLYLSSIESLSIAAKVQPRFRPTFWGYHDDRKFCQGDCGLDVPLAGRSREEVIHIFVSADRTLREVGFERMRTFAVRGWLDAPMLAQIAAPFGYQYDLTSIHPRLITPKLKKFPFVTWIKNRWPNTTGPSKAKADEQIQAKALNGGIVELSEQKDVINRFELALEEQSKTSGEPVPFKLVFSQETAYYGVSRIKSILKEIGEKSRQKGVSLVYTTPSEIKNGRPNQENMRISRRF